MNGFTKLSESLNQMIKEFHLEKTFQQSRVLEIWPEVVGEQLSSKTKPVSIEHGKLIVRVESPAWRNEIQFHKEQIIRDLNNRLKKKIVETIIFK